MSVATFLNCNDATDWAIDATVRAVVRRANNPSKLRKLAHKLEEAASLRQLELAVDNADHEQSHDWFAGEQLVYLRIVSRTMAGQLEKVAGRAARRSRASSGSPS